MFERNSFSPDEPENNWLRRALAKSPPVIQDPESIWSAYHVEQGWRQRYYYTDERKTQLAITATHDAIKTSRRDAKTVSAMVDLAEARGWKTVRARGPKEFRREAWIQAHVKGNVAVTGYWETSADWREVAKRRTQAQESKQAAPTAAVTSNHVARNPEIADLVKRLDQVVSAAERGANPDLLGELTPAEKQRLNSTEKDPIEYWERASDKTLASDDIIKSLGVRDRTTEIANGWTRQEAEAMNAHLDAKAAREWERSEPDNASARRAERMADATDPMHDARREQQADTYRARQAARDAARARAAPSVHSDADRARAVAQTRVASPVSTL